MKSDGSDLFGWLESAGERVAEGSPLWLLGAWIAFTAIAAVAFWVVAFGFRRFHNYVAGLQGTRIRAIKARGQDLLSEQEVTLIVLGLLRFVRYAANALLLYIYLTFVFGLFPATRSLAASLFGYFVGAAHEIGVSLLLIATLLTLWSGYMYFAAYFGWHGRNASGA